MNLLVISCPDRPGIIAAVSDFLFRNGANVIHSDQQTTHEEPRQFFLRIEFEGPADLGEGFAEVAECFSMNYRFIGDHERMRLAIFVSKEDHCLQEILWQIRAGDIRAEVAAVVGNHDSLRPIAESFGLPFHHIPVEPGRKAEAEDAQWRIAGEVDLVVLAKYMQILSGDLIAKLSGRVINIHHSFLPAFIGAKPYHQAYQRGVKLIGATAHYVTEDLDAGPIIEQDVERVDHRADVAELRRIGRHIERSVLARAVKWHTERRVFVDGNRTVVFP